MVSRINTRKNLDQCGFSCTVLSPKTDDFAVANAEREIRKGLYRPKPFADTFNVEEISIRHFSQVIQVLEKWRRRTSGCFARRPDFAR